MRYSGQFTEAGTSEATVIALLFVDCGRPAGEGKAKPCYTVFALSDLAVSGGLAFNQAGLPGTDFPKPLQRIPMSLLPGDSALDL